MLTAWPLGLISTMVLSRLPLGLGVPCGPTSFWKVTKTLPSSQAMSSGCVIGSDLDLCEPTGDERVTEAGAGDDDVHAIGRRGA